MTRNQFLGASLEPVLTASTPEEFVAAVQTILAGMAATNFPERVEALADEIVLDRPHLVGLQEVFRLSLNGATGAPPFRDHLDDLLAALSARGANYYVAGQVRNLNTTIPVPGLGLLQAVDRDVILARGDVQTWPVTVPGCRVSLDGCNYRAFVSLASPIGPINIERGFVAVDAQAPLGMARFVNTHLEIPELPIVVQAAQATELVTTLAALPNPQRLPVVLVGDINSAPTDKPVEANGQRIVPPYRQFVLAGYVDAWVLSPGVAPGLTCCQAEDLLNAESELHKRVDVILSSRRPWFVFAHRVGIGPWSKTTSGLWPSDHAGVVARIVY
jgi:endonuclease/exonuclease/phosphatase family metal-dependent hydrolase